MRERGSERDRKTKRERETWERERLNRCSRCIRVWSVMKRVVRGESRPLIQSYRRVYSLYCLITQVLSHSPLYTNTRVKHTERERAQNMPLISRIMLFNWFNSGECLQLYLSTGFQGAFFTRGTAALPVPVGTVQSNTHKHKHHVQTPTHHTHTKQALSYTMAQGLPQLSVLPSVQVVSDS